MNATFLFNQIQSKLPKPVNSLRKKVASLMHKNHKYLEPIMDNAELLKKLEEFSEQELDEVYKRLEKEKLESPNMMFWVYNGLLGNCGVARFLIGDFKYGIFRASFFTFYSVVGDILDSMFDEDGFAGIIIALLFTSILGFIDSIISLIDLMIVGIFLRNQNLEKLNNILEEVKAKRQVVESEA